MVPFFSLPFSLKGNLLSDLRVSIPKKLERDEVLRYGEVRGLADLLRTPSRRAVHTRLHLRVSAGGEPNSCRRLPEFIWEWRPVSVGELQRVRP